MPFTALKKSPAKKKAAPPGSASSEPISPGPTSAGDAGGGEGSPLPGSTQEPAPTRSARRAQRTRSRLEKAALAAFVEVGVGATTIEMITERADVGKGTFYQYFSTQEELLAQLVRDAVDSLLARISKAVGGCADIRSVIEAIVNAHLDYFQTNREEFILFFQGHGMLNLLGAPPEDLESSYLRYLERLEGLIRERVAATPGDVPLRRMACAIAGFAVGYLSFAVLGLSEDNLRETYRPVRESLVNGLTALVERALGAPAAGPGERPLPTAAPAPANPPTGNPPHP